MKTNEMSFAKTNEMSFAKTNEMSFAKTNEMSFAKTKEMSLAGILTRIYSRRYILLQGLVLCTVLGIAQNAMAQPFNQGSGKTLPVVEVYKSAQCGCCKSWAEHLQKNGFKVILHDVNDVPAARRKLGMPSQYGSCHTAKAGQYLIEGHVPAADIKRLLRERPKAMGIAVPAMPPGSPGMESEHPVAYDTLLIGKDGEARIFARH